MAGFARALLAAGGMALLGAAPHLPAADGPPDAAPTAPPTGKLPDVSGYATYSDIAGTIVSATNTGIKLRVTWYTTSSSGGNRGGSRGGFGGGHGYRHPSRPRPPKVTEHHQDYDLPFVDGALVRWHKLPQKVGVEADKRFYTANEQAKLKQPYGAPGWAAEPSDLKAGHIVEVVLVRPKEVPASKAQPSDLKVKYAVIWGEDPRPLSTTTKK